jgi:hypothetical protein
METGQIDEWKTKAIIVRENDGLKEWNREAVDQG